MASRGTNLLKTLFVVVNKPVQCKIPYFVCVEESSPFLEQLYERQSEDFPHLRKKELEKLCIMPLPGPRYSLLKFNVPYEWFDPKKLN